MIRVSSEKGGFVDTEAEESPETCLSEIAVAYLDIYEAVMRELPKDIMRNVHAQAARDTLCAAIDRINAKLGIEPCGAKSKKGKST